MNAAPLWDIFCKVIDNYGDIGVCWRLSVNLAQRGQPVRLWVDDASALAWMAPHGHPGVQVLPWDAHCPSQLAPLPRASVVVEAFGCELPPQALQFWAEPLHADALQTGPLIINLEYLSAEDYVQRSHGLPSPLLHGPGAGLRKFFFYPGFTGGTGGLLREPDLSQRQARFDRQAWLAQWGVVGLGQAVVSLFCYEPPALPAVLQQWAQAQVPMTLLVASGRALAATNAALAQLQPGTSLQVGRNQRWGALQLVALPALTQTEFDHLLWASDLNLVRGEDSLVRALWAQKPLVWQLYPQPDDAHVAKLDAFLDWIDAPPAMRQWHQAWNGVTPVPEVLAPAALADWRTPAWSQCALDAGQILQLQPDLTTQLLDFIEKNR